MKTTLGRHYLPIGSALMVPVEDINDVKKYVVACPTMFRPQDINGTRNVYYAFLAGLALIDKHNSRVKDSEKIRTLVCPGLGTGYGKLSYEESAKQIREAFIDYFINYKNNDKMIEDYDIYLDEPNKDEQPNVYENLELKNIDMSDIIIK